MSSHRVTHTGLIEKHPSLDHVVVCERPDENREEASITVGNGWQVMVGEPRREDGSMHDSPEGTMTGARRPERDREGAGRRRDKLACHVVRHALHISTSPCSQEGSLQHSPRLLAAPADRWRPRTLPSPERTSLPADRTLGVTVAIGRALRRTECGPSTTKSSCSLPSLPLPPLPFIMKASSVDDAALPEPSLGFFVSADTGSRRARHPSPGCARCFAEAFRGRDARVDSPRRWLTLPTVVSLEAQQPAPHGTAHKHPCTGGEWPCVVSVASGSGAPIRSGRWFVDTEARGEGVWGGSHARVFPSRRRRVGEARDVVRAGDGISGKAASLVVALENVAPGPGVAAAWTGFCGGRGYASGNGVAPTRSKAGNWQGGARRMGSR